MTDLRDLVRQRVDVQWARFAADHPHLARAIDRVRLTDDAVAALRDDPAYVEAIRAAALDEAKLAAAADVLALIERTVGAALRR